MRVIDAHMHLMDVTNHDDWYLTLRELAEAFGVLHLYGDFMPPDYLRDAGPDFRVDAFVHVSASFKPRAYLDEAEWIDDIADRYGLDLVHIGTVEPSMERAGIIADLERQARSPRFRGARVLNDFAPDSAAATPVLDWLSERGFVFDLTAQPAQMKAWLTKLEDYPDLSVVLEHTGWPTGTDDRSRADWKAAIEAYAAVSTGACKISGLGMTTLGLSEAGLRPWLEHAITVLGWDRVVFGSNMPIDRLGGTYTELIAALKAVTGEAALEDQQKFWAGNAERLYRL